MSTYRGKTISSIYEQLMTDVITDGRLSNPRGKWTKSLSNVCLELENSVQNKFLIIPGRQLNYAFAMAEVLWILAGRGDIEYIGFYNKAMAKYLDDKKGDIDYKTMKTTHDLHASYGKRIRRAGYDESMSYLDFDENKFRGIDPVDDRAKLQKLLYPDGIEVDQFQMVYNKIQDDVNTRQAVVTLWDYRKDNFIKCADHPCNTQLMFEVEDGGLNLTVIRRSNDIVWGLPYNIVQFSSVQEYMASWLGLKAGRYCEYINNLHIYTEEYPELYKFFEEKVKNQDSFVLDLETIDNVINSVGSTLTSKAHMDRYIQYCFASELEWRHKIHSGIHDEVLNLYIEKWLGELKTVTQNHYWSNTYKLLLAYHLYKAKKDEHVKTLVLSTSNQFRLMAAESMKRLTADIIKPLYMGKISKLIQGNMEELYTEVGIL